MLPNGDPAPTGGVRDALVAAARASARADFSAPLLGSSSKPLW